MPAPATGREDWDAETKSRCAGKFIGNIADENIIVAVETFLIIKKDRFLSVFKCFFFLNFSEMIDKNMPTPTRLFQGGRPAKRSSR